MMSTFFSQNSEMYLQLNESDIELIGRIIILKKMPQEETNFEAD